MNPNISKFVTIRGIRGLCGTVALSIFYQTKIAAMHQSESHDWWKYMKTIMGLKTNGNSCMHGVINKTTDGDCGLLANTMNAFFVSVSNHLPRLSKSHKVFAVNEELPDQCVISVCTTFKALKNVKANKATGTDNTCMGVKKLCKYSRPSINCSF